MVTRATEAWQTPASPKSYDTTQASSYITPLHTYVGSGHQIRL